MSDDALGCRVDETSRLLEQDRELVKAAWDDPSAFGRLYDKYYPAIFRYIYRRTLDMSLTEDLTSETFFAALRGISRYKWRRVSFGAWLYRIATNEVNRYYQRRHGRTVSLVISDDEKSDEPVSSIVDVETQLILSEEYASLHEALRTLKPKYQTVIVLRFFEEMTIPEVSAVTGSREGTVKSQLHRALQQLRSKLTGWEAKERHSHE